MKNTNHKAMMENQQQETGHLFSTMSPERNARLLAEWNRDEFGRNSVRSLRSKNRDEEQLKALLPAGQWVNRGENDGLDFFL
jgi:hypothetical protein